MDELLFDTAGMVAVMMPDLLQPTDEIRPLGHLVVEDLQVVGSLVLAAAGGRSLSAGP